MNELIFHGSKGRSWEYNICQARYEHRKLSRLVILYSTRTDTSYLAIVIHNLTPCYDQLKFISLGFGLAPKLDVAFF